MITRLATLLAFAALLVAAVAGSGRAAHRATASSTPMGPGPVIPVTPAVQATNGLAVSLLRHLGGDGNLVFSPYSIEAALAMVDQGAAGGTATQIDHVLGGAGGSLIGSSNGVLAASLAAAVAAPSGTPAGNAAQLLIANGLWVNPGLSLESPFSSALSGDFGASPQSVDFAGDPNGARQTINSWVSDHTGHRIDNLMGPGTITARTALVLANAIYLKARWSSPFDKRSTASGPFTTSTGKRASARFMTQSPTSFGYARGKGYRAVDLPYGNSKLSMLAVLPKLGTIASFEDRLTVDRLGRLTRSLSTRLVDLRMPKLQLTLHTDLVEALSSLGMPAAFTDAADFSGITKQRSLKIAAVEHGADLNVDEAGTVAAAATGISLEPTAIRRGPAIGVTLNHPYLLFLRDDSTGAILFAARVADPAGG